MLPIRWSPPRAKLPSSATRTRSLGLWPGRSWTVKRCDAGGDHVAVADRDVDGDRAAVLAVGLRDLVQLLDPFLGDAVQAHHAGLELILRLHRVPGEPGEVGDEPVVGHHLGARALPDPVREPGVVVVLVRDDDPLDVLELQPVRGERRLELLTGLGPVGAGVDERQRLAEQHVRIDDADRVRDGERQEQRLAHLAVDRTAH